MMGDNFRTFLEKYPFASAKIMSEHFDVSRATVKEILSRELELRKYTRRWMPHSLDDAQKNHRTPAAIEMLALLREREEVEFDGLVTGDESWFIDHSELRAMFAPAREKVPPYVQTQLGVQKVMIKVFFTTRMLSVLEPLLKGAKFNQDFFIDTVLPELVQEKRRFARRNPRTDFMVHMDNSAYHNGHKITNGFDRRHIILAPHPPYPPDLSPCDFWLFGFLKESIKGVEFSTDDQLLEAITRIWNDVTFEDIQSDFQEWIDRLSWVIGNNDEYYFE
jgi:histone-lysine N-methyltransferase SETMAR